MLPYVHAILALQPDAKFTATNTKILEWLSDFDPPAEEDIQAKIIEIKPNLIKELIRPQRNDMLAKTDWWVLPDRTPTQEQLDYRQSLRDLPSNSPNAEIDENGNLTGVTWPTPPSE